MRLCVHYQRVAELLDDRDQQLDKGGFLVRVEPPAELEPFSEVELELRIGPLSAVLPCNVVQLAPGVGVAVAFQRPRDPAIQGFVESAQAHASANEPAERDGAAARHLIGTVEDAATEPPDTDSREPTADAPDPSASRRRAERMDAYHKVQAADKPARIQIALYGNRNERMQIIRGTDRTLHRHVLRNPGLTLDEVVFIAKLSSAAPELLKSISDRKEWSQRPEIAIALIRNPKTPVPIAINLIRNASLADLRQLAKVPNVRMPIVQAIRKRVLRG